MLGSCRILAPAKVNIGLNVLPGTVGGYHNIESVFQAVSLCDLLIIEGVPEHGVCSVECTGMNLPKHNTLTAAYEAFCKETGKSEGVRVVLTKNIPHGAGLGGGSSDAASFIMALERLFSLSCEVASRARIASQIGSDVFFFLLSGKKNRCAVVTGRGECVRPIRARSDIFFVLVCPNVYVSTKEAYSLLDAYYANLSADAQVGVKIPPRAKELEQMYYGDVRAWRFANSFTHPVLCNNSQIAEALNDVRATGAVFADMSGSGSSVYGLYLSYGDACQAFRQLERKWERCFTLTSI